MPHLFHRLPRSIVGPGRVPPVFHGVNITTPPSVLIWIVPSCFGMANILPLPNTSRIFGSELASLSCLLPFSGSSPSISFKFRANKVGRPVPTVSSMRTFLSNFNIVLTGFCLFMESLSHRDAGYRAARARSRTCSLPASDSSVVLAFARAKSVAETEGQKPRNRGSRNRGSRKPRRKPRVLTCA